MQVLTEFLRERNLKVTPHRELILDTFLGQEGHHSVEDIYRSVKQLDPRVGYTTVYRTMKILAECGLAREIDLADGITRYEHLFNHEHHDHMICTECGMVIEFFSPDIESLQDQMADNFGFKPTHHSLRLWGICSDCQKKAEEAHSVPSGAQPKVRVKSWMGS